MDAIFLHTYWVIQPTHGILIDLIDFLFFFLNLLANILRQTPQLYDQNITFPLFALFQILQLVEF